MIFLFGHVSPEHIHELHRLAQLGRLSAGLLHDMVSPLTAASLELQQLQEQSGSPAISRLAHNLRQLEQYIESARKQWVTHNSEEWFSVAAEIKQVIGLLAGKARKAKVRIVMQAEDQRFHGDPVQFHRVILNLMTNAIEAYQNETAGRRVEVVIGRVKDVIRISVCDWGVGIAPELVDAVFEPFYTTKETTGGSGLGLAVVQEIVANSFGGSISVSSCPLQGTRFTLLLPAQKLAHKGHNDGG